MSTLQTLRTFINQRLAVAVDDIFGLLETTVSNYEEEINRQRRLLEAERSEFLTNKAGVWRFFYIVLTLALSNNTFHSFVTALKPRSRVSAAFHKTSFSLLRLRQAKAR